MRKILSPVGLFAIATLLIALPGLLQVNADHPQPRVDFNLRALPNDSGPPPANNSIRLVPIESSSKKLIVRPWVSRWIAAVVLSSIPVFTVVYALWPRVFGRPLHPYLGRWHVALISLPILIAPIAGFLVLPLASMFALHTAQQTGRFDADGSLSNILMVQTGVEFLVAGFWLAGLTVFALNARTTFLPPPQ